jgi:hypothetical protein
MVCVWRRRDFPRVLPLATCLVTAWLLPGCAHEYRPPKAGEPHALVKLRLAYHAWSSALLEQSVTVDGDPVRGIPPPAERGDRSVSHSLVVKPGPAVWAVQATFFHNDVTTHAETYDTTESAPCGSSTCTQIRPHTRLVNHLDRVDDASCRQDTKLVASAGETYVLEFDYQADQQCTLRCHRQAQKGKGAPTNLPCVGAAGSSAKH